MVFENKTIPLDSINFDDNTYRITTETDIDMLSASIRNVGLINPPLLLKKKSDFTALSGFRRIAACRYLGWQNIKARIMDNSVSKLECVKVAITDNIHQRSLNLIETSRSINMLSCFFEDAESLAESASKLGLPANPSILKKIRPICHLPLQIQSSILSNNISLAIATELGKFDHVTGIAFTKLFNDLKVGLNKQREIITLIKEISLREDISIQEMLSETDLQDILNNGDLDRTQKAQKVRIYLKQRRFPSIAGAEKSFEKNIKALKMGAGTKLIPPRDFEDTIYTLTLSFKDITELRARMTTLEKILQNPRLKNILDRKIDGS